MKGKPTGKKNKELLEKEKPLFLNNFLFWTLLFAHVLFTFNVSIRMVVTKRQNKLVNKCKKLITKIETQ